VNSGEYNRYGVAVVSMEELQDENIVVYSLRNQQPAGLVGFEYPKEEFHLVFDKMHL